MTSISSIRKCSNCRFERIFPDASKIRGLAKKNIALERLNAELKEFTYVVSHDLKAPLRGIAPYSHELLDRHSEGLTERARFCAVQILKAADNLNQLIEDLLQYSRLERETPGVAPIDIQVLIDRILNDYHEIIAARHIALSVDIPFQTVPGWLNGYLQIFSNLIDNAVKYSRDAEKPRIKIIGTQLEDRYRFEVRDNGIGFDMQYHDRIFGLFNRLVLPDDFEGTGAGLAIVVKAVEKLNGKVWAESSPGEGAVFFVEIPKLAPDIKEA
jgi:light-regulated signal transduction histidine kinase (bacteriophytochrome)